MKKLTHDVAVFWDGISTCHWRVEFVQISPILALWCHDIYFFVNKRSSIPDGRQRLLGIGTEGAVGASKQRDTTSGLL